MRLLLLTKIYYVVFALLTIVGGYMGFRNAQSKISLVAGLICGAILIAAAVYIELRRMQVAFILGLVVSVALAGQFVPKYLDTRAPVPAGLMSILSILGIILTLLAWYRN
jgi:uncharacterized membrane protein (UPF0136 family)